MFGENYTWNYDYVQLACDSGFAFQRYPAHGFDKNKFCVIDIDRIIREKDVASVEKFIFSVCQFVLDPEQARILDDSFVKVFRLSQLVIDYLLFCKRYLDKTLTEVKQEIDKTKRENQELNLFVDDLQEHVSLLMREIREQNAITSFQCEHCNKKFSTEEFLNSHLKRRHFGAVAPDTDKLHMEIKELKGRLNSTEKLIQQEQNQLKPVVEASEHRLNELKKIDELQQKFEELRVQVQSELKVLQTQYNFQDKYEKLFEKMTLHNNHLPPSSRSSEVRVLERRRESTTQTEDKEEMQVVTKDCDVKSNTEQQITELKEALEVKVSTSLEKIETQMQSFWNKLHEMEIPKHSTKSEEVIIEPPSVKPRSKYTMKDPPKGVEMLFDKVKLSEESTVDEDTSEAPGVMEKCDQTQQIAHNKEQVSEEESKSEEVEVKMRKQVVVKTFQRESRNNEDTNASDTEIDTVISSAPSDHGVVTKKHTKSSDLMMKKRPLKNPKKVEVSTELFNHFKEEVENIMVMGRLQDLGVSPEWKSLPPRSFQRALEIVNHKANLTKKTYPDYDIIYDEIEAEVSRKAALVMKQKNQKNISSKARLDRDKDRIIPVCKKSKPPRQKMYETDSESEAKVMRVQDDLRGLSAPYSAVIKELKTVTTRYGHCEEVAKNEETKGVLKNYPSVGSLTKKRVLFNLYNNENFKDRTKGESTTSITSSILDGSPKKAPKIIREKDIEDLSDFDFSDV